MIRHHLQRSPHISKDPSDRNSWWPKAPGDSLKAVATLFTFIILFASGSVGFCQDLLSAQARSENFSIAIYPRPNSTPLYIGIDKGYFKEEGLTVTLKPVATGKMALEALRSGQVEAAGAADTPIARSVINGERIAVIATIAESQEANAIIAKKDSGIAEPGDLRGKTVGVTRDTSAEYFLHIYLVTNNIDPKEVSIVDIEPDKIVDALLKGEVEAVSTWSPHKLVLIEKLGTNAVILTEPALYLQTFNIVTTQNFVKSNFGTIKKLLRGVLQANAFIKKHPKPSQEIVSKYLGTASVLYEKEWPHYSFTTILDQSLVLNLEDQARWMLKKSRAIPHDTPNFMEFIETGPLKAVQPQAIRIIGK